MYNNSSIKDFLNELGSKSSTPGGGSAAALTGALNAAIVNFIANLTIGKEKYKDVEDEAKSILTESNQIKREMLKMMDEDSEILSKILASYKTGNKAETKSICKDAVEFSLDMTQRAVRLMELTLKISKIGNKMLASDFEVAAYIGDAAVGSAIANIKINLKSLDDNEYKSNVKKEYKALKEKSSDLKEEIINLAN